MPSLDEMRRQQRARQLKEMGTSVQTVDGDGIEFPKPPSMWKRLTLGIGALFIAGTLLGTYYIVDQGDLGVILRMGKVSGIAEPGLNFKVPFADRIVSFTVRTQKLAFENNTKKGGQSNILPAYSKDIQPLEIGMSINYSLIGSSITEIYSKYGTSYEEKIIVPQIQAKVKDVFGKYAAAEIVNGREKIAHQILGDLQGHFQSTGINIESIQIENIDFSNEFEKSIERRMKAEIEVAESKQNLEREKINAEMVRTTASGAADAKVLAAEADAKATKLAGEAEAYAVDLIQKSLERGGPNYIAYVQAQKWNGATPVTMVPGASVPFLGVK